MWNRIDSEEPSRTVVFIFAGTFTRSFLGFRRGDMSMLPNVGDSIVLAGVLCICVYVFWLGFRCGIWVLFGYLLGVVPGSGLSTPHMSWQVWGVFVYVCFGL